MQRKGKKQERAREKLNCDPGLMLMERAHQRYSVLGGNDWTFLAYTQVTQLRAALGGLGALRRLQSAAEADLKRAGSWRLSADDTPPKEGLASVSVSTTAAHFVHRSVFISLG